ncbi:unnamed protein product [Brassica oleracea var. botrytis]
MLHKLLQIFRRNKSIHVLLLLIISSPTLILWMFLWTALKTQIWRYTIFRECIRHQIVAKYVLDSQHVKKFFYYI